MDKAFEQFKQDLHDILYDSESSYQDKFYQLLGAVSVYEKGKKKKAGKPRSVCDTERDRRAGKDPLEEETLE